MDGTVSHLPVLSFLTCTVVVATGLTVSLVIVLVVVAEWSVSAWFVTGLVNALLCLTVTSPTGSKPLLSANSLAPIVRLVALFSTVFVTVLLPSVKVTVAPGVTLVTVIPRFGSPPVFVT